MTEAEVQNWLDRYVEAWRTHDPDLIGALWTEDATYKYHPGDEPVVGRDAIVANWVKYQDQPLNKNPWTAQYRPWVIDGDRAIAIGETHYEGAEDYHNSFQLTFRDGACAAFVEWYMEPRKPGDTDT
ncbi:MAG: nuclear transport factor 2 family protein [Acidimicrobiia bacterium]|nr:nuclear transport factor 2 family protein [Acidimicrobiia bacterium]MDH3471531.1 nuclear transport factor 2 family protein [Acidimicrobiia bacterium]